jgi:energy-coupling factor transporter ATP-binding protein EcfA2
MLLHILAVIIFSIVGISLIVSSEPVTFIYTMSSINKSWLAGVILLLLSGVMAATIASSYVFAYSLSTPLIVNIILSVRPLIQAYLSLTIYLTTITSLMFLNYIVHRRIKDSFLDIIKGGSLRVKINHMAVSLFLISIGITGLFLENLLSRVYVSTLMWVSLAFITGFTTILFTHTRGSLFLPALAPLTPATFFGTILLYKQVPETTVDKEGIEIGFRKAIIRKSVGRGKRLERIDVKALPEYINTWKSTNPHILIVGDSGTGKSSLAKTIAYMKSQRKEKVLILDFHGEYIELLRNGFRIYDPFENNLNPLDLDGQSPTTRVLEFSYMVSELFNIGELQRGLLIDVLRETYRTKGIEDENPASWKNLPPTIHDVIKTIIEREKLTDRREEINRLETLRRYLELLIFTPDEEAATLTFSEVINNSTIVALYKAPNPVLQQIISAVIFRKALFYNQRKGREKHTIIVDEAHRLLRSKKIREIIESLVTEARKFGTSIVLVTQSPLILTPTIISNMATRIIFRLSENRALEYISKIIAPEYDRKVFDEIKTFIRNLEPYHAILDKDDTNILIILKTQQYNSISKAG